MTWVKTGGSSVVTTPIDNSQFFYVRENLHDTSKEVSGYVDSSDGSVKASATYTATEFISVTAGATYTSSYSKSLCTYDSNKIFKGSIDTYSSDLTSFNAPRSYVIPSGVAYVRTTRGNANGSPMFVKGTVLPDFYLAPGIKQLLATDGSYVTSLNMQMNPFYGLKWNVLGDSVTEGTYIDDQTGVANISYHEALARQYGIKITNYGIGGTTITKSKDNSGNGFVERYAGMSDNADIVTVFGGINDYAWSGGTPVGTFGSTDTNTMYGAMDALCKGLIQKYPTKKLGFILPYGFNEYKGSGTWKPYEDAMIMVLEYYAIPYLNLRKDSLLNANIDFINTTYFKNADKTHPNTKGSAIIARKIFEFLKTL
jgi:lysophospholipase L1-like esterase